MKRRRRLPVISLPLPPDCDPSGVVKVPLTDGNGFSAAELTVGRVIRSAYIHCRSIAESQTRAVKFVWRPATSYDRGVAASVETRQRLPIWPCVARWCLANKIEPVSYVTWRFLQVGLNRPPEPTQLISEEKLRQFRKSRRSLRRAIKLSFAREMETFRDGVDYEIYVLRRDKQDAWFSVLSDDMANLSPLFRYAVACSVGSARFFSLASRYFGGAVLQYMQYPAGFKRYWGRVLPKKFVNKVKANYLRVVGE